MELNDKLSFLLTITLQALDPIILDKFENVVVKDEILSIELLMSFIEDQ